MKDYITWILVAIAGKVVTDSLPPIGVKDIYRYTRKLLLFAGAYALLGYTLLYVRVISSGTPTERDKEHALALTVMAVVLTFALIGTLALKQQQREQA